MPPKKERKTRVVWTDEEIGKVVLEAVKLYLAGGNFIWFYINLAQKVLDEDRRRKIIGQAGVNPQVLREFCEVRKQVLEEAMPVPVTIEKEILVERPREEILRTISTKELFRLLAERFAPFVDALPELLHKGDEPLKSSVSVPSPLASELEAPVEQVTPRKPRVLLFGFLPGQEHHIRAKAAGFDLELRFQKKEGRQGEPPQSCNWCIALRKMRHSMGDKLKDRFGDRMIIVEGLDGAMKALADINSKVHSGVR